MKKLLSLLLAAALALSAAGCAAKPAAASSASSSAPAAVSSSAAAVASAAAKPAQDRAGNAITVPDSAAKIVSLAPATTQVLDDLGLADKIVAVDTQSPMYVTDLPADTVQLDLMNPDLEKITALAPDIVFASTMSSAGGEDVFQPLRDAGICVAEIPTSSTIADVEKDVQFTADCVGQSAKGQALVDGMESEIAAVKAIGDKITDKKTVLFEISPLPSLYSFGTGVYLDEMLGLIGAKNALADQQGWVAVTEESAIAANPDVILTNDNYSSKDPVADILALPGWENVTAVKNKAVYYIDNGTSSLPNHNITKALVEMAKAIYPDAYAALS